VKIGGADVNCLDTDGYRPCDYVAHGDEYYRRIGKPVEQRELQLLFLGKTLPLVEPRDVELGMDWYSYGIKRGLTRMEKITHVL
jgi:hypothetical protein